MTRLGFRTAAENNTVELYNSVELTNYNLVTGATTAVFGQVNLCSGTSADYTVTLPTAVGNAGKMICIKCNSDATILSKVVTVDGAGTEKIGISLTRTLAAGGFLTIVARETAGVGFWDIIALDQGAWIAWTPVVDSPGFSANPTPTGFYFKGIKTASIRFSTTTGTSNNAAFTLSGLPTDLINKNTIVLPAIVINSGARQAGAFAMTAATGAITIYGTAALGGFTASGNKGLDSILVTYELNA